MNDDTTLAGFIEEPAIESYKRTIAAIRVAITYATDPLELEDLKDALECACHSAFIYTMFADDLPASGKITQ